MGRIISGIRSNMPFDVAYRSKKKKKKKKRTGFQASELRRNRF